MFLLNGGWIAFRLGGEKRRDEPKPLDDRNENSKLAFDVISAIFLIKL